MHIGKKILQEIESTLKNEYSVNLPPDVWQVFECPLVLHDDKQFKDRQAKAIQVIDSILKYHGKGDIVPFLAELARIEPRIQELQPCVRDHVVHAVNTFLLGVYILRDINFPQGGRTRYGSSFMWKLTGPTHDLGYPIEIARNIQKPFWDKLNDILGSLNVPSPRVAQDAYPENLEALCNNVNGHTLVQDRLNEWALGIDVFQYYAWLKQENRTDHGVIGALAQLKVWDAVYQKNNPNRRREDILVGGLNFNEENFALDIVLASAALFVHNIDRSYSGFKSKINFRIAPLAFLLFLCDTFQEWDRYSKHGEVLSGEEFDIDCCGNSICLVVPEQLEVKISDTLNHRLTGLRVEVNGRLALS